MSDAIGPDAPHPEQDPYARFEAMTLVEIQAHTAGLEARLRALQERYPGDGTVHIADPDLQDATEIFGDTLPMTSNGAVQAELLGGDVGTGSLDSTTFARLGSLSMAALLFAARSPESGIVVHRVWPQE